MRSYCTIIANNLLAEFWHIYREGPRGPDIRGTAVSDSEILVQGSEAVEEGMSQHLLVVGRSLHIVTSQTVTGSSEMILRVRPKLQAHGSCSVKSYGYIGSYMAELNALIELSQEPEPTNVLKSILCPKRDFPGHFVKRMLAKGVSINESQRIAVNSLEHALEKIQGPPGTGKSTTIFHIITARVPVGARVLVTCSRNVAVESIAQKLERCTDDRMLVFGNAARIGETARRYVWEPCMCECMYVCVYV